MNTDEVADPEKIEQVHPVEQFYQQLNALTPRVVITPVLIGLNAAVYLLMAFSGAGSSDTNIEELLTWGANFGPRTTSGEWWRLFTSLFLHVGAMHLFMNMFVLFMVGRIQERLVGNTGFLALYLIAGLFASLTSVRWNSYVTSAGASGAVFGICGGFVASLFKQRAAIPDMLLRRFSIVMLVFIIYNVLIGIQSPTTDTAAHVGGLVAGFICGIFLSHPIAPEAAGGRRARNALASAGAGILLIACAVVMPKPSAAFGEGIMRMQGRQFGDAISAFTEVLERDPYNVEALAQRAHCHIELDQYREALADCSAALSVQPSSISLLFVRAICHSKMGNFKEAIDDLDDVLRIRETSLDISLIDPLRVSVYNLRGFAWYMLESHQAAEADWRVAADEARFDADKAGQLENIALIYLREERWEKALAHTSEIEKLKPDSAWNLLFRAIAADQLGRSELAIEAYGAWKRLKSEDDLKQLRQFLPERFRGYLTRLQGKESPTESPAETDPNQV